MEGKGQGWEDQAELYFKWGLAHAHRDFANLSPCAQWQ